MPGLAQAFQITRDNPRPPPRYRDLLGFRPLKVRPPKPRRQDAWDAAAWLAMCKAGRAEVGGDTDPGYAETLRQATVGAERIARGNERTDTLILPEGSLREDVANPRKKFLDGSPGRFGYYYPTSSECLEYASGRLKPVNRRTKPAIAARNWAKAVNAQARHRYRLQAR